MGRGRILVSDSNNQVEADLGEEDKFVFEHADLKVRLGNQNGTSGKWLDALAKRQRRNQGRR